MAEVPATMAKVQKKASDYQKCQQLSATMTQIQGQKNPRKSGKIQIPRKMGKTPKNQGQNIGGNIEKRGFILPCVGSCV